MISEGRNYAVKHCISLKPETKQECTLLSALLHFVQLILANVNGEEKEKYAKLEREESITICRGDDIMAENPGK